MYVFKWTLLSLLIGGLAGSASAWFLLGLDWATNYREAHLWVIALLPIGGLIIGLMYHYYGTDVVKGNNQLFYTHGKGYEEGMSFSKDSSFDNWKVNERGPIAMYVTGIPFE